MSRIWTQEHVDAFNAKNGKLPSKNPVIPVENSGKGGISSLNSDNSGNRENLARSPSSSRPASFALGRMKAGKMNKTETAYAHLLENREQRGEVLWWAFEPMNLRLAEKCFYKVDFMVMLSSGQLECHEVKGFWTDDALVKIKAAAEKFPFRFISVKLVKGSWEIREF